MRTVTGMTMGLLLTIAAALSGCSGETSSLTASKTRESMESLNGTCPYVIGQSFESANSAGGRLSYEKVSCNLAPPQGGVPRFGDGVFSVYVFAEGIKFDDFACSSGWNSDTSAIVWGPNWFALPKSPTFPAEDIAELMGGSIQSLDKRCAGIEVVGGWRDV